MAQVEREEAWKKLMKLNPGFQPWAQGDEIDMADGRKYIVQRTGEWHKIVEEAR